MNKPLFRIFVSSTYIDLIDYRRAAEKAINDLGQKYEGMEYMGAMDKEPTKACLDLVEQCDLFIGIYAWRYGYIPDGSEFSITKQEYDHAQKLDRPCLCYLVDEDFSWPPKLIEISALEKLRQFKNKIAKEHIRSTFKEPLHLENNILRDLSIWLMANKPELSRDKSISEKIKYYLNRLAEETSKLSLIGLGRSLQVELPIEEAYVPLKTRWTPRMKDCGSERFTGSLDEKEHDVELNDLFDRAQKLQHRGIVLLGEPGSGKTTGARQLAWRLAGGKCSPEDIGLPAGTIPVFLRFRNLGSPALAAENGLRIFLEAETTSKTAPDPLKDPGADLWNYQKGLLWILDGLDEVIDPAVRIKVAGWVEESLRDRIHDYFLITCRFQGFSVRIENQNETKTLLPQFLEFDVRPLDNDQINNFIKKWYRTAYVQLGLTAGPAADNAEKLFNILKRPENQTGHIRELSGNPLLLTILCIVYHEEKKLPANRAELYNHCVRVLLELWRKELYQPENLYDASAAQSVLSRIAWWMHQKQDRTAAPLGELEIEAGNSLVNVSKDSGLGLDGSVFLERMRCEAGIMALVGDGRCGFLHLSFQEYLAAEYAANEGLAKILAPLALQSWWREVALLSLRFSRPFCEEFFREMLASGIVEKDPDFAERALSESLYFTASPFVKELENADIPKARVAAILRLLKDRASQAPELEEICRRLLDSVDQDISGFAREILARLGVPSEIKTAQPGIFIDERTGITFIEIPAGKFEMGSTKGLPVEQPVHPVIIPRKFYMAKYPVTNAQYARFLNEMKNSAAKPDYWNDRRFNQPEQPVVGVSWEDVKLFCKWANCRLPTEAEWEYACRAGTSTEYSFGDDAKKLGDYAWFIDNSGNQTQPAGAKKPNSWGLHDMHGNVWEWCQDWYDEDYYNKCKQQGIVTNPEGPDAGSFRVLRGGGWSGSAVCCRSVFRNGGDPGYRNSGIGFRLVFLP
jgi:formylglycine-generating enzyme required for sulfatase activity